MPVTSTNQASIELTQRQASALLDLFKDIHNFRNVKVVKIEETNMEGAIAVTTYRGVTLVNRDGSTFNLRQPREQSA